MPGDSKGKFRVTVDLDGADQDIIFHVGSVVEAESLVQEFIEQGAIKVNRSKDESPHYFVYYPIDRVRSFTVSEREE